MQATFDRWAAKAPVRRAGPQRTALRLWAIIRPALLERERREIGTALDHALFCGAGRREFDSIASEIRRRLFNPVGGNQ